MAAAATCLNVSGTMLEREGAPPLLALAAMDGDHVRSVELRELSPAELRHWHRQVPDPRARPH